MEKRKSVLDIFLDGARRGVDLWLKNMLPAIVLGFTLIRILEVTGILSLLNKAFTPVMAVFGLPGEAMSVLATTWMSIAGGCGAAASLATAGRLNGTHIVILMPMIFLMGSQAQFIGRVLAVSGVKPNRYGVMCAISIINALIAGLVMRFIV